MVSLDLFCMYRSPVPTPRAQAIQIVCAAHGLARRGHRVVVPVDVVDEATRAEILDFYGLSDVSTLRFLRLGRNPFGSAALRLGFARWLWQTSGEGIVIARSKRRALSAARWARGRFRLVLECHEVDSRQAAEAGRDPEPWHRLEEAVLGVSDAVVCNAPGTLALLRESHRLPPAAVVQNGTAASRVRQPVGLGEHVLYAGSVLPMKGLDTLARAAARLERVVEICGPEHGSLARLQALSAGWLRFSPAVQHVAVPDRLASARVLVLPLSPGLYGEYLASPLKLWDYFASGRPVVAADTASVRAIAPSAVATYRPGDAADLARALARVWDDPALARELVAEAPLRTWDDRAAELETFLLEVLA